MEDKKSTESYSDLRKEAELRIGPTVPKLDLPPDELSRLVHDLQVHQVELELQNEELRRIELELAVSRQNYFDLFNYAPVGYVVIDEAGIIQETNRTFCELTGKDHNKLLGKAFANCIAPLDRPLFLSRFNAIFKKPEEKQIACRLSRSGGDVPVMMTAQLRPLAQNCGPALMLIVTDVSDLRAEEAARRVTEEKNRFQADVLRNINDLVTVTDLEGRITYVNDAVCRMFGKSREELIGQSVEIFSDPAGQRRLIAEALEQGGWRGEVVNTRPDGTQAVMDCRIQVLSDPQGRPHSLIGISTDITARKKAEADICEARARYQDMAQHLEKILEEERKRLARELHDEIGQILTALKIDLVLLQDKQEIDQEFKARAGDMQMLLSEGIQSVHGICRSLRPGALEDLGLEGALQGLIDDWQRRNQLECRLSADLPDGDLSDEVKTAVFRMVQEALTNVSGHARASSVDVKLECRDARLCCAVADDGVGIEEGAESKSTSFGLLGMRERIEALGGTLSIRGEKDKGTCIEICIPL